MMTNELDGIEVELQPDSLVLRANQVAV